MAQTQPSLSPIQPRVTLIKPNGFTLVLESGLDLKAMQGFVGGYIEIIKLPDGRELVLNEDGRDRLPHNKKASAVWREAFPIEKYPNNNPPDIYGSVLLLENYVWPTE